LAQLVGQVEAGKARLIATAGTRRPPAAPNMPTATEQGFPEMTIDKRGTSNCSSMLATREIQPCL
ncbi:MAG: hypothetical protein ABWZ74_09695, partial [Hyphomicrobiaceae bacterium]